jgi:hypothetical protein
MSIFLKRRTSWFIGALLTGVLVWAAFIASSASASPPSQTIPEGFSQVLSEPGVSLYRKDYANGNPDFVQVADLSQGAAVKLLYGSISNPGSGQGEYGGDNPSFSRQDLQSAWTELNTANPNAFCITNGDYFSTDIDPTVLAFPLKKDGKLVSDGYASAEFPDQKLILELWADHADIQPLTQENLLASTAPDILGGLSETADKGIQTLSARTFAGVADNNQDGQYDTVLVYTTLTAKQPEAASMLRGFGAVKVIMLDGGSSTQLICKGAAYILSDRAIPQTLGVLSKPANLPVSEVSLLPTWPVLVEGETLRVDIALKNVGAETWTVADYQLVNIKNPWGAETQFALPNDVAPGQFVTFSWTTDMFPKWGVFDTEWAISKNGMAFGNDVKFNVIVLPKQMADKKKELEAKIKEWSKDQVDNIQKLVVQWVEQQLQNTVTHICSPASIILPAGAALYFGMHRKKKNGG